MAWPSGDTIRKLVVDDVKTTLEAITGSPTYKTTVELVEIAGKNALTLNVFPAAIISPPAIQTRGDRLDIIQATLDLTVTLAVRSYEDTIPDALYEFVEDVRVALLSDVTRGGVAMDTQVTADAPFALGPSDPIFGADLSVEVLYRQLRTDPATAI